MIKRIDLSEKAANRFREGYNCSQSILLTMLQYCNIRNRLVPKIATAFGGGIGRSGSVCGALTGGVMAISIMFGTNEPSVEKRQKAYALANSLYKQFEAIYGTVNCRELIGYNLSNPDELDKARKERVFEKKCSYFIKTVVEILLSLWE